MAALSAELQENDEEGNMLQHLIRAQLVSQLIRVHLVLLDRGSNQQNL